MGMVERIQKLLAGRAGVREQLDPTPVEAPFKFTKPPALAELVRQAVQGHISQLAQTEGFDSFEEFDDFEVDEEDMSSEHDLLFDPDLDREVTRYEKRHLDESRKTFDKFVAEKQKESKRKKLEEAKKASEKEGGS